ncbi:MULTISPECIES: NfeD family protein [unclassified Corynebacterium]|uniref:NfeD family protein n=1 Tax=unclassified Corynebacterium TaxID=2624378 RepID=UPI0029CA7B35|nr:MULTISPECIES: NfeD family protein [unclassified Corynebacterium]WPF67209.1 NfeD family protein [Corynebacterium sp. 22KM0430]WPF69698.1 NfeD family protein [Corynebacterium sp. 21KM1197]
MEIIAWFIAALVLAGLELAVGEFTLLMLGGGALAASGVALTGAPLWAQVLAFALISLGLLFFVKPILRRKMQVPLALDTSSEALVGHSAEVLETVHSGAGGQIRLDGSIWSAITVDPHTSYSEGEHVTVVRIDGPTAIVWKEN